MISSVRIFTLPSSPSTMRTMSGVVSRGGMKSMTRTRPSELSHSLSRISVSSRYRRSVAAPALEGASSQRPCSRPPSNAPKHELESKRGNGSQSTEPDRPTSAAV